jgi:2-keto-4-pentenoate hydratase
MTFDPIPAAKALCAARSARHPAGPLPKEIAPRTEAEGIAVQVVVAESMDERRPAGFKIGATTKRMQAYLGLTAPAAAFMTRKGLHTSGVVLPWANFHNPGVECEIGARLGADLSVGTTDMHTATKAVADLFAAVEIVENRYGPPPAGDLAAVGTPTLIADQVYHAAAVLGAPAPDWSALDLKAVQGRIFIDSEIRGEGLGADLLGHPLAALTWLANSAVAQAYGGLKAGQIVMLGSVTPPIWLDGPCTATVEFTGMSSCTLRLA